MLGFRFGVLYIVIGIIGIICNGARAASVVLDVGTPSNAANWTVTGAGAVSAPAFIYNSGIALTSNEFRTGSFATGGSLASFKGFWYADRKFNLPANATNVKLQFSDLGADDRVVLQLNGTKLGDFVLDGFLTNPPLTGLGVMSLPPGPPDQAFAFTGTASGTVTSGFVVGGENDLRLIVNNTFVANINGPTVTFQADGDGSSAYLTASLTYDVPEPAVISLIGLAFAQMLTRRRLINRCRGRAVETLPLP